MDDKTFSPAAPIDERTRLTMINDAFTQAVACHEAGQLSEAEALYRGILEVDPLHAEASHNLGVIEIQNHRPEASLPHFEAALKNRPEKAGHWLSYIEALIQAGELEIARQVLALGRQHGLVGGAAATLTAKLAACADEGVPAPAPAEQEGARTKFATTPPPGERREPSAKEVNLLISKFSQGEYAEGERLARDVTHRFPDHGFGWKVLGVMLQSQGRNEDALVPMQRAAELLPDDAEAQSNLGLVLSDLGRLPESEACHRHALTIRPDFAEAHYNLGNTLKARGQLVEAEASYRRTVELRPDFANALNNLGNVLIEQNRLAEAENCYRQAIAAQPDNAEVWGNLGKLFEKTGLPSEAEACHRKALTLRPEHPEASTRLAFVLMQQNRLDEAESFYRRALELTPENAESHNNLGSVLEKQQRLPEAAACYRRAIEIDPALAVAHNNIGGLLMGQGRLTEAEASYRRAVELDPGFAAGHFNLGIAVARRGRFDEAEGIYRQALALDPEFVEAQCNLGNVLKELGRFAEAEATFRQALATRPDHADAHNDLGNILAQQGRLGEAAVSYRHAMAIRPQDAGAKSNLLFSLNFQADRDPMECLEEARRFGQSVAVKDGQPLNGWPCDRSPAKLRVGLVSDDMRNHPVGYFLEGFLKHLDTRRIELLGYPASACADELTARLAPHFASWKPLHGLDDESAAKLLRGDGLHVLLDLSGHTAGNRLPVFARKPAPVQASWLGYFATTGVAEIDYLLGDPHVTPDGEASHFTETVWRLPETYLCFTPPDLPLEVAPLPARTNGYVTFGSFNNLAKMNDAVVALWARVLTAVPGSRLFLKTKQLNDAGACESTRHRFAAHGISSDRLLLEGSAPRAELLAAYHRVDIALDPFPYPGGTTSVEGLWMGVPVVTRRGDRFLSHVGETIAHNAGMDAWIAAGDDEYVALACRHAADLDRLATLRAILRQQVLASPIFDAPRFARHFEDALWGMWERFQTGEAKRA